MFPLKHSLWRRTSRALVTAADAVGLRCMCEAYLRGGEKGWERQMTDLLKCVFLMVAYVFQYHCWVQHDVQDEIQEHGHAPHPVHSPLLSSLKHDVRQEAYEKGVRAVVVVVAAAEMRMRKKDSHWECRLRPSCLPRSAPPRAHGALLLPHNQKQQGKRAQERGRKKAQRRRPKACRPQAHHPRAPHAAVAVGVVERVEDEEGREREEGVR